jgi:alkylated DNA nucleotide flippase Atl1
MILERLEEAFAHKEQGSLADLALSVEHVMPQTLSAEWIVELSELDTDPERTHRELVHTLGNLTLTGYNSELSNNPFDRKQQIYGDSHLSLNKSLQQKARWGRAEITKRARELADLAISIWPAPEEVSEKSFGFDWSRMHAAIAAIPDGTWTTYGDLAALAGTSAQAVGVHIATNSALSNAYRVLTWDGQISEGFAWSDPTDGRDPRAVLASEGLDFVGGKALQAQRLPADSLMELLGWFDPDDDFPNVG